MPARGLATRKKSSDDRKRGGTEADETARLRRVIAFRDRLSGLLSHTQEFSAVVDEVFAEMLLFSGADGGLLRLVNERTGTLDVYQSAGLPQGFLKRARSRRFGEGLAGYVAQSGEAIRINTKSNVGDLGELAEIGVTSVLVLPLRAKERVIGVFELFTRGKQGFSDDVADALAPASRQIGIAIENMRLLATLEGRVSQRNRLYRLMRKLQASSGLDELLAEIVNILAEIYAPAYAVILLYDATDHMLRIKAASSNFMERVWRREIPLNQGITGYAAVSRSTVLVNDTSKDPRYLEGMMEIRSELAAPLIAEDKLIGVLDLESPHSNAFSNQDSQLLTIYAQQAAMAIANVQLFEQAREQNLAKSRMISALSHEFRTPLAIMKSYAWYLKNNPDLALAERIEQLDVILEEVEHLNELIENLLNLGRLEQGRIEWQIVRFELDVMLGGLTESIRKVAEERGIEVTFDPGPKPLVWGDVSRLRQAFMNLVSNAIKYNRNGGKVWIAIEDAGDDFARVRVEDTGMGMESRYLEKIFTPFFRIPGSSAEGVGLGLALAQQFIEAQGGWIEVESTPGKGTRFYVYLSKRGGA